MSNLTIPITDLASSWLRNLQGPPTPSLWNLKGLDRYWQDHPSGMDFLQPSSPNFAWKNFQTAVYLDAFGALFEESASGSSPGRPLEILDAACGVGRMIFPLLERGHHVHGVDTCLPSLKAATRHLTQRASVVPALVESLKLFWGDVREVPLPAMHFDRVLALELLCYIANPAETVAILSQSLKPGGLLVASVEAWPGAHKSWPEPLPEVQVPGCKLDRQFGIPDDLWVHPMEESEFAAILTCSGLNVLSLEPVHFFADGPRANQVKLAKPGHAC